MLILRPVIGWVEGEWWGGCHREVVDPVSSLVVSDTVKTELDQAPLWERLRVRRVAARLIKSVIGAEI